MAYSPFPGNSVLLATSAESITATTTSLSETALTNGRCVVVTIKNIDTGQMAANCCVQVRNTTNGMTVPWQSAGRLWNGAFAILYFNMPVSVGDTVVIDLASSASLTASKTDVAAMLSPLEVATLLRPDGRGMPVASSAQPVTNYNNSLTPLSMVSAPGSGFRILLGPTINLEGQTSTSNGTLIGTINGTANVPLTQQYGLNANVVTVPCGILLDPNTAVLLQQVTNAVYVQTTFTYDLVPI